MRGGGWQVWLIFGTLALRIRVSAVCLTEIYSYEGCQAWQAILSWG